MLFYSCAARPQGMNRHIDYAELPQNVACCFVFSTPMYFKYLALLALSA